MLNLGPSVTEQERLWTQPRLWIGPSLLSALLLAGLLRVILADASQLAGLESVGAKQVGIALFGPYLLAVELASLLLLGALVAAYHLGHIESDKDKK